MNLDHLLDSLSQARSLADLDHLLDNTTLTGIYNKWLFDCLSKNYSRNTLYHYGLKVGEFLEFLGQKITQPEQVTDDHLRLFLLSRQKANKRHPEKSLKAWSIHGYYRAIHAYFSYMIEQKILKHSPMEGMKPPKVPTEIIQPYKKEQLKIMLNKCDDTTFLGSRTKAMILLYLSTGLRKLEMTNIELKHVDVMNRTIRVMGKGSKERVVRFGTQARNALMRYVLLRKQRDHNNLPWLWLSEEGARLEYGGIGSTIGDLRNR